MAGISVRSGVMVFGDKNASAERTGSEKAPLAVLLLGDFAGAAPRSQPLEHRKHLRLDADNFDEVFARLGVAVKLPFDEQAIRFASLQDMHPDHLYDNISLFNRYRAIKKQLESPSQFNEAVALLSSEGLIEKIPADREQQPSAAKPDLLDAILSGNVAANTSGFADQLIRQTVAPYLQPKEHPKVPEYLAAVDAAMGQVMRRIMHSGAFQKLESAWRGLDLLQRRLDLDRGCQLSLLDVSEVEVRQEVENSAKDFSATALGRNIVAKSIGKTPYDAILLDEILSADAAGLQLMELLLALAEKTGAAVLAGGDSQFANWISTTEKWQELRKHPAADRVFVSCPRVLLRLPYGKRTAVIDSFSFEELPQQGAHEYYLWSNGAYLLLLALVQAERQPLGACHIENLPLHVYRDDDGDEAIKPCAEKYFTEKQVGELEGAGFTVLQSVQNRNSVMIQRWRSLKPISC